MYDKVYDIIDKVQKEWSDRKDLGLCRIALVKVICSEIKAEVATNDFLESLNGMDR